MGVVLNPDSEHVKELQRWDTPKRLGGHAPDSFQEYPMMLYLARANESGSVMVGDPIGELSLDLSRVARALAFTKTCQRIVRNERERAIAEHEGWRETPQAALRHHEDLQVSIGTAAAEENFRLTRMSEQARTEFDQADRATSDHLPTLPAPRRKPGPKPKSAVTKL